MMKKVNGKFELTAAPLESDKVIQKLGGIRMIFEKQFFGPIEAKSSVSMIGVMNKDIGSGSYVALEIIEGSVEGLKGSFGMQHSSSMNRGKSEQFITVIPDSGTEELSGISGNMIIEIVNGQHFYTFEYTIKN